MNKLHGNGVDITRNLDYKWNLCAARAPYSPKYQGPSPNSEIETKFIKKTIDHYKTNLKAYLSLRINGHSLLYPYAHTDKIPSTVKDLIKAARNITTKINQKAGNIQVFVNSSIHDSNSEPQCGHTVDYAYDTGIPLTYEMRVFMGNDKQIMSNFQTLPVGYENSLRNGYFNGIRELYNIVIDPKRYELFEHKNQP